MIAVLGATGTIGRHVRAGLEQRGAPFRSIARPATDLRDPDLLRTAFAGADQLFLLTPDDPDQDTLEHNALHAARAVGIERIVKISGGAPSLGPNGPTSTAVAHWRSEQRIEDSGLHFQFLRPSFLMQNLRAMPIRKGLLAAPMGHAPIAMIDARDVADCAVTLLLDPAAPDTAWHLTGPAPVTFKDAASKLGARYLNVPPRLAAAALRRQGAPPHEIDHAIRMAAYYATGADATPTDAVKRITGRPARPLDEFLTTNHTNQKGN